MSGAVAWRFTRTGASTLNDIPRLRAQFVDSRSYKQVSCGVVAFVNNPYDTGVYILKDIVNPASSMALNKVYNTLDINDNAAKRDQFPDAPDQVLNDEYFVFIFEKTGEESYTKTQMIPQMLASARDSKVTIGNAIETKVNSDARDGWVCTFIK